MDAPLEFPPRYNAAQDLLTRQLGPGRAERVALDDGALHTFADLDLSARRAGNALRALDLQPEQRVLLCLEDGAEFHALFLGAILIGAIPVPINTLLVAEDCAYVAEDSRARLLVVSPTLSAKWISALTLLGEPPRLVVAGSAGELAAVQVRSSPVLETVRTGPDDVAFWLYSSGSTGRPKAAVHLHRHLVTTAVLYGQSVLGLREDDVVFSAAKLFFAYGLGNALTFPLYVGARSVLLAARPTPAAVLERLRTRGVTVFCGVPTLFAALLAASEGRGPEKLALRCCISAGEALPKKIGERFRARFGVDILDGLGSTELLHIFLSNRHGQVRYGTTGFPVPGYELQLRDDAGGPTPDGELGALWVNGPTACTGYWNKRAQSLATFHGPWTRTGDTYTRNPDGSYTYGGRGDDMLKVSGNWVSPFEVESILMRHPAVLEAAVVGAADDAGLIKPKAVVVLREPARASEALADELKAFVKSSLAPYKYPRWVLFVRELPKTATGKIQRFKLRDGASG